MRRLMIALLILLAACGQQAPICSKGEYYTETDMVLVMIPVVAGKVVTMVPTWHPRTTHHCTEGGEITWVDVSE